MTLIKLNLWQNISYNNNRNDWVKKTVTPEIDWTAEFWHGETLTSMFINENFETAHELAGQCREFHKIMGIRRRLVVTPTRL